MKRAIIFAVLGFIILTQYVNCSSYSASTLDDGSLSSASTGDAFESLRVLNGDTYMNCDEDHVQIGGICNTADSVYNCIEVRMTRERSPIYWNSSAPTDNFGCQSGYRIKCENGHFFAVIPKPIDTILNSTDRQNIEYQLYLKLYKSSDNLQWEEGIGAPGFNLYIQQAGACTI